MPTFAELYDQYEKESGFTQLDPGNYTLRVKSCKNNAQKEYLMPTFEVVDGPQAGCTVSAGVLSYVSPGARSVTFQKLEKMGLGKDYFKTVESWDDVAAALKGRIITADIDQQKEGQYAGRNEIPDFGKSIVLLSAPDAAGNSAPVAAPPPPAAAAPPAGTPPPPPPTAEGAAEPPSEPSF